MAQDPIAQRIVGLGFEKRAGHVFTIDLASGLLGWLGLNRATQGRAKGEVEINPVVGVRFTEVERLVAECRDERFHPYAPPTISTPLGYVMPERRYQAWVFTPESSEERSVDLCTAIAAHGLPFMRSVKDLSALRRCLDERMGFEHQLVYRRLAAALLSGDDAEALAMLESTRASLAGRTDPAALELRAFAARFEARCHR